MASFRRIGEWERIGRLVRDLGPNCIKAQRISLMQFGLKTERIAKEHISAQDLQWAPLSPNYLYRKVRAGHSENIYVMTSTYFQSINSWVEYDTALIGVRRGKLAGDGSSDLGKIARDLEYGNDFTYLPARPLWRPTFAEVMKWHAKFNQPVIHLSKLMSRY